MIARIWHGRIPAEKEEEYLGYLHRCGIPGLEQTPGNRGVYVMTRVEGDIAHFTFMSLWESLESIKAFSGEDPHRARY